MQTTSDVPLVPRLFTVRDAHPLGQDEDLPASSEGASLEDDNRDVPPCVDCLAGVPLAGTYLRPGDRITETDTPEGPYYLVTEIDREAGVIVVDPEDGGGPVPLAVDLHGVVLKAPGSPAS